MEWNSSSDPPWWNCLFPSERDEWNCARKIFLVDDLPYRVTYPHVSNKGKNISFINEKRLYSCARRTRRFWSISSFLTIASSTVLLPFILYHIQAISMCFTSESTCLLSKRAARSRSNVYYPVLLRLCPERRQRAAPIRFNCSRNQTVR